MLRAGQTLQITVVALLGLGVIAVHSAGMTIVHDESRGPVSVMTILVSRHGLYALLAVLTMALTSRLDIRQALRLRGLASPVLWVMALSLVLVALTLVPGLGKTVNGASRWLYLGPKRWGLSFQPSELAKWSLVLAIACWCSRRSGIMRRWRLGLSPILVLVGAVCGLVMIEDLGTAVLIGMVSVGLLLAGGARWWHLAATVPPAAGAVVAAILHSPYRWARLTAFLNPWADPMGTGYHPIQSMLAIAQGGLAGRGLGNGVQKFGYLPEDTTDFIFATICEEMGIAGAGLVVALYLVILWNGLAIVRDCRDTFGRLLGLGVLLTVGLQALINIAVVTVVVPTKGIALPLLSAGGTGWVVTAAALGIVASLDEANRLAEADSPADPLDGGLETATHPLRPLYAHDR